MTRIVPGVDKNAGAGVADQPKLDRHLHVPSCRQPALRSRRWASFDRQYIAAGQCVVGDYYVRVQYTVDYRLQRGTTRVGWTGNAGRHVAAACHCLASGQYRESANIEFCLITAHLRKHYAVRVPWRFRHQAVSRGKWRAGFAQARRWAEAGWRGAGLTTLVRQRDR